MKKWILTSTLLSTFVIPAKPVHAEPISLAAASTAVAVGQSAIAGTTFTFLGLKGFAAVVASFAVRATLGYALNSLTSKPEPISRGYSTTVNALGTALPQQVIYGETQVGGVIVYQALSNTGQHLHRFIVFAGHEINSFEEIYLDGQSVTLDGSGNVTSGAYSGNVRIKQYLGTDSQTADADAVSEITNWTTNHRLQGLAYLYVRFNKASNFPTGIPTVTALIKGKKVLDTRTNTTAWSENPAMILRDYITEDFGLGASSSEINDFLFNQAADICDIPYDGGPQFTCNGAFTLDSSPEEIIRALCSSMAGIFWSFEGEWACRAGQYLEPLLTITEDDLRGEVSVGTRHSRRDNFNTVKGQFKGAETQYNADEYEPVVSAEYLTEDNNQEIISQLDILFTDTETNARRLASMYLERNRLQMTVSAAFGTRALRLKVGDNVRLTLSDFGWTEKVFEVADWRVGLEDGEIVVNMILRENDPRVYAGDEDFLYDNSFEALRDENDNALEEGNA